MDLQIQNNDILIKKSNGNNIPWLSERLLMDVCNVTQGYLWKVRSKYKKTVQPKYKTNEFLPDTGKSWRFAKTTLGFYYCFENIPDRQPTFYKSKIGTKNFLMSLLNGFKSNTKTKINQQLKEDFQQIINKNIENQAIRYYMFDAPYAFNEKQANELAESLAWCKFMKLHYDNGTHKHLGVTKKKDFLHLCTEILQEKQLTGLKVNSPDYLRHKINAFPASGMLQQYNNLISKKYNNDNARIVGKYQLVDEDTGEIFDFDTHKALMFYGFMNPGYSSKESYRKVYVDFYKPSIEQMGYEPVAYRTFTHHMSALHNRVFSARERHGKDYYKKMVQTYVPSKKLQYAHSLFAGDGSGTINYKYLKADGKWYTMKLYVMLISDVASRKIVGWSVAPKGQHSESTKMTKDAVKMAIKNCDYQTMFEFISDNHKAFKSKESKNFLNLVFNKVRRIEKGNSQANPAETEFRLFKQSLKGLKNFGSTSWDVGLEGQSNPDYFKIENLPIYEDAILQFHEIVKKWNAAELRDGTTPNERFTNKHPKIAPLNDKVIRLVEGNHTKRDVSDLRGFVVVSKSKGYSIRKDYAFEIDDCYGDGLEKISKALGYKKDAKVKVVWDEENADLYTPKGKFIMTCPRTKLSSQSHAEADEESKEALGHHLKRKKEQTEAVEAFEQSLEDAFGALPYGHQMAVGGNKESYNKNMSDRESESKSKSKSKVLSKKEIADRDFDKKVKW